MVGRPQPSPGLLRRLDDLARGVLPALLAAGLAVLAAGPTGIPALVPAVVLPAVVFWSIYRPAAMSPPAVFILGLLQDLLSLAPLGTGAVTLLIAHGLSVTWRRALGRRGFAFLWLVFCCLAAGAAALGFVLTALLGWMLPPPGPAVHQAVLTALLWPPFALVFARLHALMTRAEETV